MSDGFAFSGSSGCSGFSEDVTGKDATFESLRFPKKALQRMPAATLTFRLSMLWLWPHPRMYSSTSALLLRFQRKPSPSLPSMSRVGDLDKGFPRSSVETDGAEVEELLLEGATPANTFQPASLESTIKPAGVLTENNVTFSEAPAEALSTTGEKGALFRVEIATAETPSKSNSQQGNDCNSKADLLKLPHCSGSK